MVPWAGPLEYVVSRYQKVILIVTRLEKRFLTLTINKEDADIISELILKLAELKT